MQLVLEEEAEARGLVERAAARDAAFESAIAQQHLRSDALGSDRHHRRYHLFGHSPGVVWVGSPEGERLGVLSAPVQVRALAAALLRAAPRERDLAAMLEARWPEIVGPMSATGHPNVPAAFVLDTVAPEPAPAAPPRLTESTAAGVGASPMDVDSAGASQTAAPASAGVSDDELRTNAERDAIAKALGYLSSLCDTLAATDTGTAECTQLKEQLQSVQSFTQLIAVRFIPVTQQLRPEFCWRCQAFCCKCWLLSH